MADESAIRGVDPVTGVITTVAGNGNGCPQETDGLGDGCPATDAFIQPVSVAVDDAGNLFISDGGHALIRRVDAVTQIMTLVAGGGSGARNKSTTLATAALRRRSTSVLWAGLLSIPLAMYLLRVEVASAGWRRLRK